MHPLITPSHVKSNPVTLHPLTTSPPPPTHTHVTSFHNASLQHLFTSNLPPLHSHLFTSYLIFALTYHICSRYFSHLLASNLPPLPLPHLLGTLLAKDIDKMEIKKIAHSPSRRSLASTLLTGWLVGSYITDKPIHPSTWLIQD